MSKCVTLCCTSNAGILVLAREDEASHTYLGPCFSVIYSHCGFCIQQSCNYTSPPETMSSKPQQNPSRRSYAGCPTVTTAVGESCKRLLSLTFTWAQTLSQGQGPRNASPFCIPKLLDPQGLHIDWWTGRIPRPDTPGPADRRKQDAQVSYRCVTDSKLASCGRSARSYAIPISTPKPRTRTPESTSAIDWNAHITCFL